MKKIDNEKEWVRKAINIGSAYAEKRGAAQFEDGDSSNERLEFIYRLLVRDKLIQPMPELQVSQQSIRHRLTLWAKSLDKKA